MLPVSRMREWLLVTANFQDRSSIGHVARSITRSLHTLIGNSMVAWCTTGQRPVGVPDAIVRPAAAPEVCLFIGFPNQARLVLERHDRVVGVYVCESSRINQAWVAACNQHTAIIVPSDYCQKAFQDSGVKVPVHVIPHGVEGWLWTTRARPRPNSSGLRFGVVAALNHYWRRKAPDLLIEAWLKWVAAHPNDTLEWRTGEFPEWTGQSIPGLQWCHGRVSEQEMAKWYRTLDALIFPSRAEGFGLPGLEALACGTPIIAPSHSGLAQYVDDRRDVVIASGPAEQLLTYEHPEAVVPGLTAAALLDGIQRFASRPDYWQEKARELLQTKWSWQAVCQPMAGLLAAQRCLPSRVKLGVQAPDRHEFPSFASELGVGLGEKAAAFYARDPSGLGQVVRALIGQGGKVNPGQARLVVIPANPNEVPNYRVVAGAGVAVPYVAWESSEWPIEWVRRFNDEAGLVVVPQQWQADALVRCGCRVPVHVVPQAWQTWRRREPPKATKSKRRKSFTVGFMGVPVARKNLDALVTALPAGASLVARLPWVPVGVQVPNDPRCSWLVGPMTNEAVQTQFWDAIDVLVCPFSGEGYSMVPREGIASNIPTVVSDIAAHSDLQCLKIEHGPSIPAHFEWAKRTIGTWQEVSPEAIGKALGEALRQGFRWPQDQPAHTWPATWDAIKTLTAETCATYVSPRDAGGGIERFALRMAEHMPELRVYRDMEIAGRNAARHRSLFWHLEYGLITQGELDSLKVYKRQFPWVRVFVIVHSACNGPSETKINAWLRQTARLFILLTDAQHQVFPAGKYVQHPWPTPGALSPAPRDMVLGTHGFVHQQKGYPTLFALARKHKAQVLVCGLAQPHNPTSLRVAEKDLRPNLEPGDRWRNEHVSDQDLQTEMSACSLLVYPYSSFRNLQASGAVREAVRWGVPIVCSEEAYFADLPREIFPRLCDIPQALANRATYQARQAEYAKRFSWDWFVQQLRDCIKAEIGE